MAVAQPSGVQLGVLFTLFEMALPEEPVCHLMHHSLGFYPSIMGRRSGTKCWYSSTPLTSEAVGLVSMTGLTCVGMKFIEIPSLR